MQSNFNVGAAIPSKRRDQQNRRQNERDKDTNDKRDFPHAALKDAERTGSPTWRRWRSIVRESSSPGSVHPLVRLPDGIPAALNKRCDPDPIMFKIAGSLTDI